MAIRSGAGRFLIFLLLGVLGGCAGSAPSVEGVWEKITPASRSNDAPAVKILTDGYFAFGRQVDEGMVAWAGGGTYQRDGDKYTETIAYHAIPSLVGRTIEFHIEFRDGQWYHTADFMAGGERFHIEEVWQRLE